MEATYSRFDANGDGRLSMYAKAPVAITATGTATTASTDLTDLEVFQRFFETSTSKTEGWAKTDLPQLLVSADIELSLEEFWAAGATSVSVMTTVDGVNNGPTRTFAKPTTGSGGGIITFPVAPEGSKVELIASATGPDGKPIIGTPFVDTKVLAGDDARFSPCVAHLELELDSPALLPGKEGGITATV